MSHPEKRTAFQNLDNAKLEKLGIIEVGLDFEGVF
jgi:hypothetical protein